MSRVLTDAPAGIGHNGGQPTEESFFRRLRELNDLEQQDMRLKAKKKQWKKDTKDDGIDIDDLMYAKKLGNLSLEEQIASHNRRLTYLKYMKRPIASQINIIDPAFTDETGLSDEQREEKWQNIGYVGGREGKSLSDVMSGHDPNGDTGRWITAGWEAGQAENAKGIKKGPAKKSSDAETGKLTGGVSDTKPESGATPQTVDSESPKRRGRPPKNPGVTYWHREDVKKVYEVPQSDAPPEGAANITKAEYESLKAKYDAENDDDWDSSGPASDDPPSPGEDGVSASAAVH